MGRKSSLQKKDPAILSTKSTAKAGKASRTHKQKAAVPKAVIPSPPVSLKYDWLTPSSASSLSPYNITATPSPLWFTPAAATTLPPPPTPSPSLASLTHTLLLLKRNLHPISTLHATRLNTKLLTPSYTTTTHNHQPGTLITEPTTAANSFHLARVITNPFNVLTTTKGCTGKFLNRAAVKFKNVEHFLGGMLGRGGLKFVDLCGAPGGFSECLLRKKGEEEGRSG